MDLPLSEVVYRLPDPRGNELQRPPSPYVGKHDEWLVTNAMGGYASGTVSGGLTRRFHGLLIAALPATRGRVIMLNHLSAWLRLPGGQRLRLDESPGDNERSPALARLCEFRLEAGLPVWRYQVGPVLLERRVLMPHMQNTVHVSFRILDAGPCTEPLRLTLRPAVHFRHHEGRVDQPLGAGYAVHAMGDRYEVVAAGDLPPLRMSLHGEGRRFVVVPQVLPKVTLELERARGYDYEGALYTPGFFRAELGVDKDVVLVASTESWDTVEALSPEEASQSERERRRRLVSALPTLPGDGADDAEGRIALATLGLAADQFLITPAGRSGDAARAHATGDEVRTVIAGYHWFTDWGRDTMISLEGLTLRTGRHAEARYILSTFSHYVRDGLIPNLFPEGNQEGLYHTADATLWFFHAVSRYVDITGDRELLRQILPKLRDIIDHHVRGTRFGIGVDPKDGLLRQGQEGYQLTWMDAKVGDWVVTPRRGKAVEINALWYNALRLCEGWVRQEHGEAEARPYGARAEGVMRSFNERFYYDQGGYLYDVVDGEGGDDAACRPNQVLAIAMQHPVLATERWPQVMAVVEARLLTPLGLRSLAPDHADYKQRYDGDLRARDAAYHQGTVWAWLIGPFLDAWLRLHPGQPQAARRFLSGFLPHLREACVGSISEVFDAEPPYTARGCAAQAWSVAEVLRGLMITAKS